MTGAAVAVCCRLSATHALLLFSFRSSGVVFLLSLSAERLEAGMSLSAGPPSPPPSPTHTHPCPGRPPCLPLTPDPVPRLGPPASLLVKHSATEGFKPLVRHSSTRVAQQGLRRTARPSGPVVLCCRTMNWTGSALLLDHELDL